MSRSSGARAIGPALLVVHALGCGAPPSSAVETTIAAKPAVAAPATPIAAAATRSEAERFVTFPERGAVRTPMATRCSTFVVRRDERDDGRVSVTNAAGATVFEARPSDPMETIDVAWCGDLDGDGKPELALFKTSGGAHCCRTDVVITLGDHPIERLRVEAGNAGGLRPEDLDGDGQLELISSDDALAELGDVPYAFAPELPIVFALEGGRWIRRTTHFKANLSDQRRAAQRDLDACSGDATCQLAWAEKIAGLSLLLGDWSDAAARLALPPDVIRTTSAAAPRLAKILRARGELLP